MAVPRISHTATLLQDGRVLVTGGTDGSGNLLGSAELYDPDPDKGTWSSAGDMATVGNGYTATLLPDGTVLFTGGGYGQGNVLASAELYQPSPDQSEPGTWSATGNMAERRRGHTATLLPDGTVLVAGGSNTVKKRNKWIYNYLASAELYEPDTKTWSSTASMASGRSWRTATLLADGKVLVAGGSPADDLTAAAEIYDPAAGGTWSTTSSMVWAHQGHKATLLSDDSGRLLVAGGELRTPGCACGLGPTAAAELYDPADVAKSGTLTGTVTLAGNSNPLNGVTETIYETGQSAKTDKSGNYTIAGVRAGAVTVIATKPRCKTQEKSATISDGLTVLNFELVR